MALSEGSVKGGEWVQSRAVPQLISWWHHCLEGAQIPRVGSILQCDEYIHTWPQMSLFALLLGRRPSDYYTHFIDEGTEVQREGSWDLSQEEARTWVLSTSYLRHQTLA